MMVAQFLKPMLRRFYAAPWITPDPYERVAKMSLEELAAAWSQIPAGVMLRDGSTFDGPPQIPDLIGIRDRRYLNHTGTHRHRSVGDLMRYAALAQGAEAGSSWGDFRLGPEPPPFAVRYTDESPVCSRTIPLFAANRPRIRTTWTRNPKCRSSAVFWNDTGLRGVPHCSALHQQPADDRG